VQNEIITSSDKGKIIREILSSALSYFVDFVAFMRLPDAVALSSQVQVGIRGKQVLAHVCKQNFYVMAKL
jgi:hypothetical protein